jgi:hypothetical protein
VSISYTLSDAGGNAVTLYPKWNYKNKRTMARTDIRMLAGNLVSYKWAVYNPFEMEIEFISLEDAARINSWWEMGTRLFYAVTRDNDLADIQVVIIENDTTPFATLIFPRSDYYHGKLELQSCINTFLSNTWLDNWTHHDTLDGWDFSGVGTLSREATIKQRGTCSAKITAGTPFGTTPRISKDLLQYEDLGFWSGKIITVKALLYATVASTVRCGIGDGIQTTLWANHSGGSSWEWISAGPFEVSNNAIEILPRPFNVIIEGAVGYCNGVLLAWQ